MLVAGSPRKCKMISLKTYVLGNSERDTRSCVPHTIDIMLQGIALDTVPGQ